jgi:hypothetical protein
MSALTHTPSKEVRIVRAAPEPFLAKGRSQGHERTEVAMTHTHLGRDLRQRGLLPGAGSGRPQGRLAPRLDEPVGCS